MNIIVSKFKEVFTSMLPIAVLVLILNFTITPMGWPMLAKFFVGTLLSILGLTVFLLGIDIGITPLGGLTGTTLAKTNKLWIVLTAGLALGFFISIAEPGLMILAGRVDLITAGQISSTSILVTISLGLALLLSLGFLRIFYNVSLRITLIGIYSIIFILALFTSPEFLAISFDASGATTGILAVPFILALANGISRLKKDSMASEKDSFGLVAIASTGAIISGMLLSVFSGPSDFPIGPGAMEAGGASLAVEGSSIIWPFIKIMPTYLKETLLAILPLLVILLVLQKISFKLNKRQLRKLLTGFIFAFVGLFIFLIGVNGGFMDVGSTIGHDLAIMDNKIYLIVIAFILGIVTILAEPAVYVLTLQIEEVTSGYVRRKAVLIPLAIGVGLAVALSIVRILVPQIQLWHYLLPGYIICLTLMFFIPKLFVGIAFDAGGVATGPVIATFIMAFIQGAAGSFAGANLMVDGFGMIAMVAMTPIITLEILGFVFGLKTKSERVRKERG